MYQEVKSSFFTVTSNNIHDLEKQIKEKIEEIKQKYNIKKVNYEIKSIRVKKDENGKVIYYAEEVFVCYFIDKHTRKKTTEENGNNAGLGHGKVNDNGESQGDDDGIDR